MEMALQVFGTRTVRRTSLTRYLAYLKLLAGGAIGGGLTATAVALAGTILRTYALSVPVLVVLLVMISYTTLRSRSREYGWHRQVNRTSSFGIRSPRWLPVLWGAELGSGIATVITQSATLVFLAVALVTPVGLSACTGILYGVARLAPTWRGMVHRAGASFSDPMKRYGSSRPLASSINASVVVTATLAAITLAITTVH